MKKTAKKALAGFMAAAAILPSAAGYAFAAQPNAAAALEKTECSANDDLPAKPALFRCTQKIRANQVKAGSHYVMECLEDGAAGKTGERRLVKIVSAKRNDANPCICHAQWYSYTILLCDTNEQITLSSLDTSFYNPDYQEIGDFHSSTRNF